MVDFSSVAQAAIFQLQKPMHFGIKFEPSSCVALGILFAPEKGEDTRHKIAEILRKKGIKLNRNEMDNLVDEIAAEIKGEIGE